MLKKYILDFYCPALKIAIEVDGKHHNEPDARAYDNLRSQELESIGVRVLRVSNKDILEDIDKVLQTLASEFELPLST